MIAKQKATSRILAVILCLALLFGTAPAGLSSFALAASADYVAVDLDGAKVYLYGASAAGAAVKEGDYFALSYTGGDEIASGVYVGGVPYAPDSAAPEVRYESGRVLILADWIKAQTQWVAVKCAAGASIPSAEPEETLPALQDIQITAYSGKYDEARHDAVRVTGTQANDKILYSADGGAFTQSVPTVEFPNDTVSVVVRVEREGFAPFVSQAYTAGVTNGEIHWIDVEAYNGIYDETNTGAKAAVTVKNADAAKDTVEYSTNGGSSYTETVPTIEAPGELTVTVRVTRQYYDPYIVTLRAVMGAATIADVTVTPYRGVYDGQPHPIAEVTARATDEVYYSLTGDDDDYSTDVPTVEDYKEDGYTFYVKVKRANHNDFLTFPTKMTAFVEQAELQGVTVTGFSGQWHPGMYEDSVKIDYPEGMTAADFDVTYYRNDKAEKAPFKLHSAAKNSENGYNYKVVLVHNSGNYKDIVFDSIEVYVGRIEQTIQFAAHPDSITYGENNTFTYAIDEESIAPESEGKITYSIDDASKANGASIHPDTGAVTYQNTGSITVTAFKETDDRYLSATQSYTISVQYAKAPAYTVSAPQDTHDHLNWYSCAAGTDGYTITPADGWEIIKQKNTLGQTEWSDAATETVEGVYTDYKIAFRNKETREITDLVTVADFAIDTTDPRVDSFEFRAKNTNALAKVIHVLSFGIFCNAAIEITVRCLDEPESENGRSAGLRAIRLYRYDAQGGRLDGDEGMAADSVDLADGRAVFSIAPDFEGTVKAEATDCTGRTSGEVLANKTNANIGASADETGYMMIESSAPSVSDIRVLPAQGVRLATVSGKTVCSGDVRFQFTAQDTGAGLNTVDVQINNTSCKGYPMDFSAAQDRDLHTFTVDTATEGIAANADGSYVVRVTVIDNAGNADTSKQVTIYKDTTSAVIQGFSFSLSKNMDAAAADDGLYHAVEKTDYGFYFKRKVTVTISAADYRADREFASGAASVTYKAIDTNGRVQYAGTDVKVNPNGQISFTIDKDFKGQIYAYATDWAGNTPMNSSLPDQQQYDAAGIMTAGAFKGFVHPAGTVLETPEKHKESSIVFSAPKPQGTQNTTAVYKYSGRAQMDKTMDYDAAQRVPLYSSDPRFGVKVTDACSGIREIKWTLVEGERKTEKSILIDHEGHASGDTDGWQLTKQKGSNLISCAENKKLPVSGNANDMVLLVELTDRAGNKSYDYYLFGIDKTAPGITVTYDNNDGDAASSNGVYFKANRTATVVIEERNFNQNKVVWTVKNAEGKAPAVEYKGTKSGGKNADRTKHIFKIRYRADGVYTFGVSYTDRAGNSNRPVDFGDCTAPKKFTIDKTIPTVSVRYDNNSAQNARYFKEGRTATVTVTEHNFDAARVVFARTASLDGESISLPAVHWTHQGDTHTATIAYHSDGDYTFDVTMDDMAGNRISAVNYGDSVAGKAFTIDTTCAGIVRVDGVENNGIFGYSDGVIDPNAEIRVAFNDVNFDSYRISLTRTRILVNGESMQSEHGADVLQPVAEKDADVTDLFVQNASGSAHTSVRLHIPKRTDGVSNDGLYTMRIEARDKAGNTYDTDANQIVFSVNRFGSVYTFNEALYNVITKNEGYTQGVKDAFVITEYNPNAISKADVEITKDSAPLAQVKLKEDVLSTVKHASDTAWYEYVYSIDPANFAQDGVYKVRVSSKDEASHTSETLNYDACDILFRVDTTAPEITNVSGLEQSEVKAEELGVSYDVFDAIGLKQITVIIDGSRHVIDRFEDLTSYSGDFQLTQGLKHQVQLIVEDKAGNVTNTGSKQEKAANFDPEFDFNQVVTVSTNFFILWYSKTPIFWSSIAAILAAAGLFIFLIVKKRRKDDGDETPAQMKS